MLDNSKASQSLFRLIDGCTQCRQIFHASAVTLNDVVLLNLIETVQHKLDQFGIELRNEIRRLEGADLDGVRFECIQENSCDGALRRMLDYYEQAFNSRVTPHTRAVLKRQYGELQQVYRYVGWLAGAA